MLKHQTEAFLHFETKRPALTCSDSRKTLFTNTLQQKILLHLAVLFGQASATGKPFKHNFDIAVTLCHLPLSSSNCKVGRTGKGTAGRVEEFADATARACANLSQALDNEKTQQDSTICLARYSNHLLHQNGTNFLVIFVSSVFL